MSGGAEIDSDETLSQSISFKTLRQKGKLKGGYENLAAMEPNCDNSGHALLGVDHVNQNNEPDEQTDCDMNQQQTHPSKKDLVTLLFEKTTCCQRTFEDITGSEEPVELLEANGSVKSILGWA